MYTCGGFTHFSIADVPRFERWMKKWCEHVSSIHGRSMSMLVFNKEDLRTEGKHYEQVHNNQVFHYHVLPSITLEYITINGSMCILTKVYETVTESALYRIPENWHNVEMWHAT